MKNTKVKKISIFVIVVIIVAIILGVIIVKNFNKNANVPNGENTSENSGKAENKEPEYVSEVQTGIKLNMNTNFKKDKMLGDLKISNIQLTSQNGMTTFIADVINLMFFKFLFFSNNSLFIV